MASGLGFRLIWIWTSGLDGNGGRMYGLWGLGAFGVSEDSGFRMRVGILFLGGTALGSTLLRAVI